MQVGDLVKVTASGLRPQIDGVALVTRVQEHVDSLGSVFHCWARMVESDYLYKFRVEHLEVISASR